MPFIVVILFLAIIAIIIIAMFNYRLKKRILESGPLDDTSFKFLSQIAGFGTEALKWGLLLFFGGVGLVVIEFIPYQADESPLPYGVETIFIAAGFLLYYFFMRKNSKDLK